MFIRKNAMALGWSSNWKVCLILKNSRSRPYEHFVKKKTILVPRSKSSKAD